MSLSPTAFINPLLRTLLYLDLSTTKVYDENDDYLGERKTVILKGFENNVDNGAFAHYEQMLHFLQCFQKSSLTEASKGNANLWSKMFSLLFNSFSVILQRTS